MAFSIKEYEQISSSSICTESSFHFFVYGYRRLENLCNIHNIFSKLCCKNYSINTSPSTMVCLHASSYCCGVVHCDVLRFPRHLQRINLRRKAYVG